MTDQDTRETFYVTVDGHDGKLDVAALRSWCETHGAPLVRLWDADMNYVATLVEAGAL